MKCTKCIEQGLKSRVYIGATSATLMDITHGYDEDGNYYCYNPNIYTTEYTCSNGHKWIERQKGRDCKS